MSVKPRFRLEDYAKINTAMHCKTLDEAETFAKFLHRKGRTFSSGRKYYGDAFPSLSPLGCFRAYGDRLCYYFNRGARGSISVAITSNWPVLEFSNFDWSNEEINVNVEKCLSLI